MKYLLIFFVFVVFCVAPFKPAQAQTQEKVIVISEKVGELIDEQERRLYHLFPWTQGFESAVFLQLPDGSYVAEITFEKDGEEKKNRISQSKTAITELRNYIENYGRKNVQPTIFSTKGKISAEPYPQRMGKPHISTGRTVGEFFAGLGAGVGVGAGGFLLGILVTPNSISDDAELPGSEVFGRIFVGLIGFAVAYPVGTAIGVYFTGNTDNTKGSFLATFGGSVAGGVLGSGLVLIGNAIPVAIGVVLPSAFATIAFNATAKDRNTLPETGFINYNNDRLSLTVPSIYYTQENTFEGKTITQNVTLVKINF